METAILSYFVKDELLHSVCDFNPFPLEKGLSIYEVIRIENGVPLFFTEHIRRFFHSALLENKKLTYNEKDIKLRIKALIVENKILSGNIKFICHWDESEKISFYAWIVPFFYPSDEQYSKGVSVVTMEGQRINPNAKRALYDLRKQADKVMLSHKSYEVLYVSPEGYLTEGSRSNLFFIAGGKLITPETEMVLPGITRSKIFELAQKNEIPVIETKILQSQIVGFQSCFLTGTSSKVLPVRKIDNKSFPVDNAVLQTMMRAYTELCEENIGSFSWEE